MTTFKLGEKAGEASGSMFSVAVIACHHIQYIRVIDMRQASLNLASVRQQSRNTTPYV